MPFVKFHDLFPEIAERETRTITVLPGQPSELPTGEYGFVEMYCNEPGCDCRRVFFFVLSSTSKNVEAVVTYGWETPDFYAEWMNDDDPEIIAELKGPALNLGSPQSRLAPAILNLVKDVLLQDDAYVERIKRYYQMFRNKIDKGQVTDIFKGFGKKS